MVTEQFPLGKALLLAVVVSLGVAHQAVASETVTGGKPGDAVVSSERLEAGQIGFGAELAVEEGVRRLVRAAVAKYRRGEDGDALAIAEQALGRIRSAGVVGMVLIRVGMFAETVTPNLLKLAAHVKLGQCSLAAPLFVTVESELRNTPGRVFGAGGVRALRQQCP